MLKSLSLLSLLLLIILTLAVPALAGETTWTNDAGEAVTGNWSTAEVVEVTTPDALEVAVSDTSGSKQYVVDPGNYTGYLLNTDLDPHSGAESD